MGKPELAPYDYVVAIEACGRYIFRAFISLSSMATT